MWINEQCSFTFFAENIQVVKELGKLNMRVSVKHVDEDLSALERTLVQWHVAIGVLLDGSCNNIHAVLDSVRLICIFYVQLILLYTLSSIILDFKLFAFLTNIRQNIVYYTCVEVFVNSWRLNLACGLSLEWQLIYNDLLSCSSKTKQTMWNNSLRVIYI